ncbi:MAG TPA: glycosyltransferase family 4 protein [Candidatus Sulfotelmatobacter sp.]|nr:glycosyltransferase family 4 protein [Candidatus Sulfotelmatobacter sp.]
MRVIRILVDSLADEDAFNAQMTSARDIMSRLDPARFHVSTFSLGTPDARLIQRPATLLIQLPQRGQTFRILKEFIWGKHDILFYVKASPASRLYLSLRSKRFDKRIVIGTVESQSDTRNEPTIKPEQTRLWERTILRSDFLFSNSSSVRASLEKEYGVPSEVVPTGVDTKFFAPDWNRPANPQVRVLFVGSLRPFKGPQVLLRAAARFPKADFVIIGNGILAPELEARAREERLDNVQFARGLSTKALREQYQQADIFLFPSRWEGSPKVILEAAACGLPVIARNDYKPETVVDGQTGCLGGSDDELLDHLGTLIASPELRRSMGWASRAHIERFDWDPITRRWEEIFMRLAAQPGSAGPS